MEWVTTTTLLQSLRDFENRDAWERFAERFRVPVSSFVRQVGVLPDECEDVAQETLLAFAKAFREGRYDRSKGRLSRWLFGIACRQARSHRRRAMRHRPQELPSDERNRLSPAADHRTAAEIWDHFWEKFLVEKAIQQARAEFRPEIFGAFERVVLDDLPPREAAAALDVPVKAVYNAKHRVLQRIRELCAELEDPGRPAGDGSDDALHRD